MRELLRLLLQEIAGLLSLPVFEADNIVINQVFTINILISFLDESGRFVSFNDGRIGVVRVICIFQPFSEVFDVFGFLLVQSHII